MIVNPINNRQLLIAKQYLIGNKIELITPTYI